jgi:hypothetical protein
MPLYMPKEKQFEVCPAGTHTAICYRIVDLGTQQNGAFAAKHKVFIGWELPDERTTDGRLFVAGKRYTYSSYSKAPLRTDVEKWICRMLTTNDFDTFDLGELLGATCLISVKHSVGKDGRVWANVDSVMAPPRGAALRASPVNQAIAFSLSDRPFAQSDFDALPQKQKEQIQSSPEYQKVLNLGPTSQRLAVVLESKSDEPMPDAEPKVDNDLDDEIPF